MIPWTSQAFPNFKNFSKNLSTDIHAVYPSGKFHSQLSQHASGPSLGPTGHLANRLPCVDGRTKSDHLAHRPRGMHSYHNTDPGNAAQTSILSDKRANEI